MATEEKPSQETPEQVIEEISSRNDIPITYEPPSPLTGCYLLIILGEPHSQEHKDIILQRLLKGLLSWNVLDCHVDLEDELNNLTNHAPEGEAARHGERLIQFASENLVTEILIHPQYNTLIQCMRNLLSSFTRHRHIIHSGYTFSGNGSWILQDATFSVSDFAEALQDYEVQRVMRAYPDTISMEINCATSGHWNKLPDKSFAKLCKIRINSVDILDSGSERLNAFINYLSPLIVPANLCDLMESSDVVGNIRFSHPTLYVFPGGQGDAALFGINGFNMLVDGGFNRKSCFWDFTRHLDRLDAVLMTRINNANIQGLSSIIERKAISNVYPQLGYFFTNIPESKPEPSLESDKDSDPLLVNLFERGHSLTSNLKSINLKPQPCYKDVEPINLYHKVGHGTLDMYVISPSRESKEVKEFLQKWNARDQNLFASKHSKEFQFPLQNLVSICAMLVWQPANPEETITRILFPGSTPDYKIMEGLDKMKHLEFVKYPVCTANQIEATSFSSTILSKKQLKSALADKSTHEQTILPSKVTKTAVAQEKDNKTVSETKTIIKTEKENAVVDGDATKLEVEKEQEKDNKTASESKPVVKSRIDSRPPKSMEKKLKKDSSTEKKSSPITTPKKEAKQPKEKEIKSKVISRVAKTSPSSTPAKSTKEANNRKVFESKQRTAVKTIKKEVSQTVAEKKENVKELKVERKAISRRPKPAAGSPMKSVKKAATKENAVIRKPKADKGAASDSSVVSTPSAATDDVKVKKIAVEQEKQILLDDLIEEQEAVREIEAVLQRSESKQIGDDEHRTIIIDKQDSTTEADEDEEYIIIEKEEQYTEEGSVNEPESAELTGKEEVKHQRDSEESEKKRKPSIETTEEEEEPQKVAEKLTEQDKPDAEIVPAAEELIDIQEGEEAEEVHQTAHKMNGDVPKADVQPEARSDEVSPVSDEKQPSNEKKTDVVDKILADTKEADIINVPESQATAESGATTAPTLPEDEHITLDEVKENIVIEEKYIKEETKETQVVITAVDEPVERAQPKPMQFDSQQPHLRELNIKTPDEVADLPVHEEADIATDETPAGSRKASLRKGEEPTKQEQPIETEAIEMESKNIDEARVSPKEEKLESRSPVEKKSPSPTSVEPKIASPVEKVEYKVEDLGEQFESTLKDVTAKVESVDESNDLRAKSPIDDSKQAHSPEGDVLEEEKDEDDGRVSVSPADIKREEISSNIIQTEESEIKIETVEEVKSSSPDKFESERKDSDADKPGDVKAETFASRSSSADLKEKISASSKEVETVSDSKRGSLITDGDVKTEIAKVTEPKPIEIAASKSPSPTKDEKIVETLKQSDDTTEKLISAGEVSDLRKEHVEHEEKEEIITKTEIDISTVNVGDTDVSKEMTSVSPVQDIIGGKEEKVASKSPSPDLKEQASVSPVPQKEEITETVAPVDSKRASLIDDSNVELARHTEADGKEKSKSPSPTKDEPISESRKESVAGTGLSEEIDRKSVSPIESEEVSQPKSVSPPAKDDIAAPDHKDSVAATKSITPTDLNLQTSDYTEVYDYSHPFDAQCPNELRETHITTVESPIVEKSKLIDLQVIDKTITEIVEGDDSSLNDIREEDEEDRVTPPREEIHESSPKPSAPLDVQTEPPRSVSPREQEVLKIVANVAEVLKSEKDITDIIPDFNEDELEKNIMQRASTPEVFSTIKESADFHDLSASLSETKTSTTSIDEKEQHEIAEKHQAGFQKESADDDVHRKESFVSEVLDDSRRESAISTFSEKDFTKDESTLDKFSRSNSSLELKHDELEAKSTEIESHSEVTQIEKTQLTDSRRQSILSDKPSSTSPEKQAEQEPSKTAEPTKEEIQVQASRKESICSKLEDDGVTVQRMLVTASSEDGGEETEICAEGTIKFSPSATTPETFSGKATPDIDHEDLHKKVEAVKETTHVESTLDVDDLARRESTSRQSDRPDSVMSHFSDTTEPELKETCSSPEKQVHEKQSGSSGKSTGSPSTASSSHGSVEIEKKDESRPDSRDIVEKVEEKQDISGKTTPADDKKIDNAQTLKSPSPHIESAKEESIEKDKKPSSDTSRPETSISEEKAEILQAQKSPSQSISSEKPDASGKTTPAELSRPESAASNKGTEAKLTSPPEKETSRPVSRESIEKVDHVSPTPSTKSVEVKTGDEKSDDSIQKSRSQSIVSEKLDISGKTTPLPVSRPESAISHTSAKAEETVKIATDLIEPISFDEKIEQKSQSPSLKEELIEEESTSSKIDSVASAIDVQKQTAEKSPVKEETTVTTTKTQITSESTVTSTFVEQTTKSPTPSNEEIKTESVKKVDDQSVSKGDASRPESAASDISSKDVQKPSVSPVETDQITTKSESVVDVVSEEKEEDKKCVTSASPSIPESDGKRGSLEKDENRKLSVSEPSRPESVASDISSKDQPESPAPPVQQESTAAKVESRSQSVASVVSEDKVDILDEQKSRAQSIVSEKPDVSDPTTPAEISRPESAASDKGIETKLISPPEKETSRPVSSASIDRVEHVSPTPSAKSVETKAGDDKTPEDIQKSRSESVVSEKVDISSKTTPLSVSRPESAVSHTSTKDAEISEKTAALTETTKLSSSPDGDQIKRDSLQTANGDSVPKGYLSRPESAASDISSQDQHQSLTPSAKEETTTIKTESRSQSVASVVGEEKVDILNEQKPRSQSIVSEKQDVSGKTTPAEVSRPESATSCKGSETKSPLPTAERESSRPASSASIEKAEHVSPTPSAKSVEAKAGDDKTPEDIQKSRSQSVVSEKVDISCKTTPLPVSRPESAAGQTSVKDGEIKKPTEISCAEEVEQKSQSQSLKDELIEEEIKSSKIDSVASASDVQKQTVEKSTVKEETTVTTTKTQITSESTVTSTFVEQTTKSPTPSNEEIQTESLTKFDDQSVSKGDASRPESAASDISSKDVQKPSVSPVETDQITTKSESVIDVVSEEKEEDKKSVTSASPSIPESDGKRGSLEKDDNRKLSVSEPSRPESVASDISSKDQPQSPAPPVRQESTAAKVGSRSQSVASVVSEDKVDILDEQKSRAQSIVSEKPDVSGPTTPAEISRPESAASDEKKSESKLTESQIQSKSDIKEEKESGDLDPTAVQIATGSTIGDIHDSADKKTSDKGAVDDKFNVHDLPKKTDLMKESRSKSVASISVFGVGKAPQSFDLEKITELSKDDSNLTGSSRKASDISTLIEDVKKIDEKITVKPATVEKIESTDVAMTTSIKDEHFSSLDHKLGQQKSAHSSLESTTSDKGSVETVLDSGTMGSFDIKEHTFDLPATKEVTTLVQAVTKEISTTKSESKTFRDSDNESLPISDDEAITSSQKYSYEDYQFERSNSELSKKSDLDIDESQNDIPPEYKSAVGYGSPEYKSTVTVSSSFAMDPMMSASFYGELPSGIEKLEPSTTVTTVRTVITKQFDVHDEGDPITHTHTTQETFTTKSDDHKFLDEADIGFEKALEEHRQARGADVMSSITSKYEFSPSKSPADKLTETASNFPLSDVRSPKEAMKDEAASSADALARQLEDDLKKAEERVASWGKPLGLPVSQENPSTPKKERKIASAKIKLNNEKNIQKRASSPNKSKKTAPIYMDLTYVPHNGNSYYSHVEFFKRVRARYYVFSGTEPSRDVYNALLEAKQTWEDKNLEVTIIPTYDTDVLGYWVAENEELLAKYHIDLSPSASRCTINLQDHETCCSAYRLEF